MSDKVQVFQDAITQPIFDDLNTAPLATTATEPNRRRRSSLWEGLKMGSVLAASRNIDGTRKMDSTGFSTFAAKVDETFGSSALTETGFTEHHTVDDATKRSRIQMAEDALRQMS